MIDKKKLVKDLREYFAEVKNKRENDLNFLARDPVAVALKKELTKWGNWRQAKRKAKEVEDDENIF